ncbi:MULTISPECIES: hypothetical protein [unclassified Microbacterium]|uniref:hypothetical protein n=1 Tax=unclassified Microbacterium TaxID=2609290 RepID=UPI0010F9A819|nr:MULTISPECIES: hypothetical protein [unclassified Microbacterium]
MPDITDEELAEQRPADDAPESEWKKYAQTWEKRAKANAKANQGVTADELADLRAKAQKAQELEDAQKTELEKALARAEAAEAKIAEREKADAARSLADQVAKEKSEGRQTPISASILRGSTREELEAHADEILALLPEKPKAATPGTGGERGDDIEEEEADAKDIAANVRL